MDKQISATEAAKLLRANPEVKLLDVREHSEWAICRIEGALHIPMAEVPERAASLPQDCPLIVLCHHGVRSKNVQRYLEAKGFENLLNLSGGIHAWAMEVDTGMARY